MILSTSGLRQASRFLNTGFQSRTAGLAFKRFSSSKKSDNTTEDPQTTASSKKPFSKVNTKQEKKTQARNDPDSKQKSSTKPQKKNSQKYVAFKDLPKPSKEFQDMSTEQFHASLHMVEVPIKSAAKREDLMPSRGFRYDFCLHPQHLIPKSQNNTPARKSPSPIEPNLAILGLSADSDMLTSGLEEHPLRESITGMCIMNPLLKEIKNKSLWEMFPQQDKSDSDPFGNGVYFNAFKDWERGKNAKFEESVSKQQILDKEFQDFCKNLQESNSFVRKSSQNSKAKTCQAGEKEQKSSVSLETSGRRKLDRALLKQYRKYRKEHYINKHSKNNKGDD